jgi:hypothetical protein
MNAPLLALLAEIESVPLLHTDTVQGHELRSEGCFLITADQLTRLKAHIRMIEMQAQSTKQAAGS